jgi:uncharacterized surface protein with fasciclin (FAS1) repeats
VDSADEMSRVFLYPSEYILITTDSESRYYASGCGVNWQAFQTCSKQNNQRGELMQKTKKENGVALMDLISKEPRLNKFTEAMKSTGLDQRFSETGNYTVFAPTDEAFSKLPPDKISALMKPENREHLKNLLLLHIVPGSFTVDDLRKANSLKTEVGRELKVDFAQDSIKIENARLTEPKRKENAVCLYGIDAVLQPAAKAAAQ